MPGPVSRDSISKCSQGNDIFAMVRNPGMKLNAQPAKQVDTLKSLQGQMEIEATAKLFKMLQNSIVVARAGKFLFLALAMPPYILLYGLPKWVMIDLMPKMFHQFLKPWKFLNDKVKNLFKSDEGNKGLLSHLKNALTNISTRATEYIKWIDRTSKALFVHLKHQTVALGYRLLQPLFPAFQKSFDAAEAITKMLLEKTQEKGGRQVELARHFVSFAWKIAKQEVLSHVSPFAELAKNKFNQLQKKIVTAIERPLLEIQKFKTAFTKKLKKVHEVVEAVGAKISKNILAAVATTTLIVRPLVEWASPKIQWSAEAFSSGREKMMRNFEIMRGFVQNLASGALDAARLGRHAVVTVVKNVFEVAIPSFVKHFFNPEGGFKKQSQQWAQNMSKKFKKVSNKGLIFAKDCLKMAKSQLFGFMLNIQKFFTYLKLQVKQLPRRIIKGLIKGYHFSIYSSIKTGEFFRWIGVWSRVLARLAWQELSSSSVFETWKP